MKNISGIPRAELEKDLESSTKDIKVCATALAEGSLMYSGGLTLERLVKNVEFVRIISHELGRRG